MSNLELFETVYYRQTDPEFRSWLSDLKHRHDGINGTQKKFRIDSILASKSFLKGMSVSEYLDEFHK